MKQIESSILNHLVKELTHLIGRLNLESTLKQKEDSPELTVKRCYGCGKVIQTLQCTCSLCGQMLLSVSQAKQLMETGVINKSPLSSGPTSETIANGKDGLKNES